MNAGPARIAAAHVTLDYCRELGVADRGFTNQNADAYLYNEGAGPLSGKPIRHRTAKADVYGYVSELLAKATDQGALDAELTATDKERLIAFLQQLRRDREQGGRIRLHRRGDRRGYTRRARRRDRGAVPCSARRRAERRARERGRPATSRSSSAGTRR